MKRISITGLILLLTLTLFPQEEKVQWPDKGASERFNTYLELYNLRNYIEDGNPNYHIVAKLFTSDHTIRNDFSPTRPFRLSLKDYIRYLEEHYPFGVQVKVSGMRIAGEKEVDGEKTMVLEYHKEVFGQYDNERIISKTYRERLSMLKDRKGAWRISALELMVPPFISADLSASIYLPGFKLSAGEMPEGISGYDQQDRLSFAYGADAEVNVTDNIGISMGFFYSGFGTKLSAAAIQQEQVMAVDKDGESYYLRADARELEDDIQLAYYSIPFSLKYYFMAGEKVSPFVGAGIAFHLNAKATSEMKGISTQEGYYPQYHVVLYDIPELGFLTDYRFTRKEDIDVESTFFSAEIQAGARISLYKDLVYGTVAAFYRPGLSKMLGSGEYLLSLASQEYNSLLFVNDEVRVNPMGLNIGIKVRIK